jgi:hypothetical protein
LKIRYDWYGFKLFIPIIEGYTKIIYLFIDFIFLYSLSGILLVENCFLVGIATITLNILYIVFLIFCSPLQPLLIVYSTIFSTIGQTITIIMILKDINENITQALFYTTNIIGTLITFYPWLKERIDKYKKPHTDFDIDLDLFLLNNIEVEKDIIVL